MQFANPPPLGTKKLGHVMSQSQHVYAIRRECVIDSDTEEPSATFANTLDEEKNV